ncbi:magnesium transporter [soil metagenome]
MDSRHLLHEIQDHLDAVIAQDTPLARGLWQHFLDLHPADIADFFSDIDAESAQLLFHKLPKRMQAEVFIEFSDGVKARSLELMTEQEKVDALNALPVDDLTDLFDHMSDDELKINLALLHKNAREKVLSLMQFDPESAGGIMDTEVIVLMQDFTVEKAIQVLQRLQPNRDIYQQLYITDREHRLVGFIKLEDLVLRQPQTRIQSFMRPNELVARAAEDREAIAKKMVHYKLMTVPVVGDNNQFLGVITNETLVDVLVEEASEDVQKMSALAPMKYPYFETSFMRLLFERGYILVALLLAQSFSTTIMKSYQDTLGYGMLLYFTTMLISTGGNTSSQTSALVIQGLITGELHAMNIFRFLRREMLMASILAVILASVAFVRSYLSAASLAESFAISVSLGVIVIVSVMLGSLIPLMLKRLNIDPAFSAGPFLATVMDILGVLIYCYVTKLLLF